MIDMNKKGSSLYKDGLMSVSQAAEFLGISRSHLYALMDSGELIYSKLGRCRRIPKRALMALAQASAQGGWKQEL
jgi:DNA binding domain, excisionase family